MQSCGRAARRSVCGAHNAYSPANALRSTFATTSKRRQDGDDGPHNPAEAPQTPVPARSRATRKIRAVRYTKQQSDGSTSNSLRWIDQVLTSESREYLQGLKATRSQLSYEKYGTQKWQAFIARLRDERASLATGAGLKRLRELSDEQKDVLRQHFDYTPFAIMMRQSQAQTPIPIPWELTDAETDKFLRRQDGAGRGILAAEIQRFAEYMTPTPAEKAGRQAVADELKEFINTTLLRDEPDKTGCEIFGSEKTGLAMPLSDIDVRLYDTSSRPHVHLRMTNRMDVLVKALRASDKYIAPVLRKSGRYPIINCQHRESGIDIQIVASPGTSRQQEVTTEYLAQIPHLRPLFYVVRTMFAMRGLLDVYSGGMGSYGSFIMLLACLNRKIGITSDMRSNAPATLFQRFLKLYTNDPEQGGLDPTKHGIAVFPRLKFLKHDPNRIYQRYAHLANKRGDPIRAAQWTMSQRNPLQPYLFTLQDPADPKNDLGKKSNAIKHIFATIGYYRYVLRRKISNIQMCQKKGKVWPGESLLLPFVGRCHEIYAEPRKRLSEYGEKVLSEGSFGDRQEVEERKEADMMKTAEAFVAAPVEGDEDRIPKPAFR